MVELKLDVTEDKLPADCFISVRIGETQKLSRISGSRTYQFPQAGDRRYGKIEVYRRIGAIGVDVDPMNEGDRQVNITCGDLGALKLNVGVGGNAKSAPAPAVKQAKAPAEGSKSKAAKEYLRKHSLELQLSEAMQAVLRDKPENPVEFLARKLLENTKGGVALPASPTTSPKASVKAPAKAPVSALSNFSAYYSANILTVSAPPTSLYAKFGGPKKAAEVPKSTAGPVAKAAPFKMRPSVGTWLAPSPKPVVPIKKEVPAFVFKPSVGTWLAPLPTIEPEPEQQPEAPRPAKTKWAQKPSVGTWLAPKPVSVVDAVEKAKKEANAARPKKFVASSGVFGPGMRLGLPPMMMVL